MINAQNIKKVILAPIDLLDAESATSVELDTQGFDYLDVTAIVGPTDIAMSALKLQGCDTSGGSYADITGAAISPLPTATDDNHLFGIFVSLLHKPRYIKIVATAGDGSSGVNFCALALLSRGHVTPNDAASRGLTAEAIVV